MQVKLKSIIATFLVAMMIVPLLSGCDLNQNKQDTGKITVIRIGTHAQQEDDPYWVDEITGTSNMNADRKKAATHALETVKEQLGVELQFLQYSSDLQQLLLQTVLAGDPYCELAILWGGCQGNILSQNILQPLDKYAHIFHDDPDGAWILPQKTFGHYYLMNRDLLYTNTWPICYNISMIEEVPSLKDPDGTTMYPSEMYLRGDWTWSNFKDYLGKIKAYYSGKKAASGKDIVAFNTNYTFFGQYALHSVGAGVYDGEAMKFATEEGIEACEYVDELMTAELVTCSTASKSTPNSGWLTASDAFQNGETVFTNCARWRMGTASSILAERGESMAVIPFPYPDGTDSSDPDYRHLNPMADSVGLLRGIDEKTSALALEAYKMYKVEYYKAMAGVNSIDEYMVEQADDEALNFGIDIFHPEIGDQNLQIWIEFGKEPANEYSESCGVMWTWSDILGKSVYGIDGFPKYRTAVEANKESIYKKLEDIGAAVNSAGAIDAVKPSVSRKGVIAIAQGTDPATINWGKYIGASDNADGEYKVDKIKFEYDAEIFKTVGTYEGGIKASVTDKSGNVGEGTFTVMVYNPDNTTPPTLQPKDVVPEITLNTDVSTINWGDYVEWAKDADGLDISTNITADTGWLDVTVETDGKEPYPVDIVATDFAGNEVYATIYVAVKKS